jgi:F0F1-type ATP synthase membrane subunit b/b'
VSKFVDRVVGRISKQEDRGMAKQSDRKSPGEDVSAIARLSDYTVHSHSPETRTGEDEASEVAADYGKLGEHVTSVLEAANQAAATIRDEARANAQEIVERAQREASTWLEKGRAETEELSHDASRLRIEAEEESRDIKERANAYATEKRREADRQASALMARAKREASEHTRAAQDRGAALAKNVELSEQRLGQLVGGLRDLAARLEELLQAPAAGDGAGAETPKSDESMEESLRRSAAAQGTSQPQ